MTIDREVVTREKTPSFTQERFKAAWNFTPPKHKSDTTWERSLVEEGRWDPGTRPSDALGARVPNMDRPWPAKNHFEL